ncbi:MAG: hypothetical protein ABIQ11_09365 [Saprospiraceae bacterium]
MEEERAESVRDELNRITSGLSVKGQHSPPEGYFNSLPDQVLNRWSNEKSNSPTRKLSWKQVIGIAAVMTGIGIGGWLIFNSPKDPVLAPITAAEAYYYINENIDEFESLIEPQAEYIPVETEIPKEDIEEYLFEELQDTDPDELF